MIFSQCKRAPHRLSPKRNKDAALASSTDEEIRFKPAPPADPCAASSPRFGAALRGQLGGCRAIPGGSPARGWQALPVRSGAAAREEPRSPFPPGAPAAPARGCRPLEGAGRAGGPRSARQTALAFPLCPRIESITEMPLTLERRLIPEEQPRLPARCYSARAPSLLF